MAALSCLGLQEVFWALTCKDSGYVDTFCIGNDGGCAQGVQF